MTAKSSMTFQALVQGFFVQHLTVERNASANTVTSYRDALKLFLRHVSAARCCSPDQLDHTVLDVVAIRSFLDWLRRERGCGARTRNHRLAVIKSFARFVANTAPEHLERCRLIRELPAARFEQPEVKYLAKSEIVQLIGALDTSTPAGRRDRALLLLLYNTGARVQEIVSLDVDDIDDEAIAVVRLLGKGRKHRTCPLWQRTVVAIRRMLANRAADRAQPLFLNARGQRLSRSGVTYLLRRVQRKAAIESPRAGALSPHTIRHTTAMHLLQSGVDITTIAAWMGHAQLSTTHAYVEIDLRMKQAAIAAATAIPELEDASFPPPDIVDWLEALARRPSYAQPPSPIPRPPRRMPLSSA